MFGRSSSLTGNNGSNRRGFRTGAFIAAVLLCAAPLFNTGCKKAEQKAVKEQEVNVRVRTAESRSLRPFVESVGTLKPYEEVIVSSEVDGILQSIRVDEGSPVSRGLLVAEIKDTDYRLDSERAEAVLKQAEASLANALQEHLRKEALYREELVTKQQFDDISARLALAQGDLERAKSGLAMAREKLSRTKIFAPMAGIVREKRVTAGDYIRNGTSLISIIRTDLLKLSFSVPEKDVGSLKEGQDIVFTADSFPGREFQGKVKTLYPNLDEKTRSLPVEALVVNNDGSLKPGFFTRVTLYTGPAKDTVVIPVTALLYDNSSVKLFAVEGNRAKEKAVKTGRKYGEYMEITDGLKADEVVVTVGQNNLMEGVLVNVAR
jgi:membrane fusion protein (multidrug efflux system)